MPAGNVRVHVTCTPYTQHLKKLVEYMHKYKSREWKNYIRNSKDSCFVYFVCTSYKNVTCGALRTVHAQPFKCVRARVQWTEKPKHFFCFKKIFPHRSK